MSASEAQQAPTTAAPEAPPKLQTSARSPFRKQNPPSCKLCRQRKVKCDRGHPCTRCLRVGAECIPTVPTGAPRGRKGGRRKIEGELLARIAKLEDLVTGIGGSKAKGADTTSPAVTNGYEKVGPSAAFCGQNLSHTLLLT